VPEDVEAAEGKPKGQDLLCGCGFCYCWFWFFFLVYDVTSLLVYANAGDI
jgi:hypothetical protein